MYGGIRNEILSNKPVGIHDILLELHEIRKQSVLMMTE